MNPVPTREKLWVSERSGEGNNRIVEILIEESAIKLWRQLAITYANSLPWITTSKHFMNNQHEVIRICQKCNSEFIQINTEYKNVVIICYFLFYSLVSQRHDNIFNWIVLKNTFASKLFLVDTGKS